MWLLIGATLLTPFVFYFDTALSITSIWNSSETFAHGYFILPISLWLIWKKREALRHLPPTPFWPALLLLAASGFGWLLAELGGVQVVRQYAFVALIPLTVLMLLGLRISLLLSFPLFFIMLAVPFGEVFIDPLINITADFTVAALKMSGIPILREGNNFTIPTGSWAVVEACSGVRYLLASFTLGTLYAYLTYRSHLRQGAFILISIIVPIVANGIRAYMIVMIGHLSGMQLAVGFDHLIYGWVFFGLVMFLMFWIGSFWREDPQVPETVKSSDRSPPAIPSATSSIRMYAAVLLTIASIGIWPTYASYLARTGHNPAAVSLHSFQSNWLEAAPFTLWAPYFYPGEAKLSKFYQQGVLQVGLVVNFYRNQRHDSELISSSNRLVLDEDAVWNRLSLSVRHETLLNRTMAVRETNIKGASGQFVVWHWYWINGTATVSDYAGKLLQAKGKLMMQGDDGASIMIFAPYHKNPEEARNMLRGFMTDNLTTLESTLSSNLK